MFHNLEIKEGAFFVADAHYSHKRPEFLEFIRDIDSKILKPTQLILFGDIFDALFGEVSYTHKANQEAIELINTISLHIEVVYLEGNHDFNLKKIFPKVKVFPISSQPLTCRFENKTVLLSHGDIKSDLNYKIYTKIIRNRYLLYFLSTIDYMLNHYILKKLDDYLGKKDDCKDIVGFEKFISSRLDEQYECDYFIEGHFHQNKTIKLKNFIYVNLGAFACRKYFLKRDLKYDYR